ncbi:MAG TPA: UDP-N-acetylmuramoyl-L-alanine--D-glutamate ligase [Saprospiraceae bacterium]|nr:UDP-N-acetylmuramoyl-L-alanine--D-glutamate ligase [Saprospiraceae bacterium]
MALRVGILGAGISGLGAALLAKSRGYEVWVTDDNEIKEERKQALLEHQIPFEEKGHHIEKLLTCDVIVKSPGIPNDSSLMQFLVQSSKEVIGEIEWAFRHAKGKIIGITGSNGKTTTTTLCHHFLHAAGINAAKVGNVGDSFSHYLAQGTADWYVCELSSFQLEDVIEFRPEVAIILNITPDHLDRYDYSLDKYAEAKLRIVKAMTENDTLIYNAMDPVTVAKVVATQMEARLWSIRETDLLGDDKVYAKEDLVLDMSSSRLMGQHNQINLLAAARAALLAGCPPDSLQSSLESFVNEAHRMELAGDKKGVRYINDSKATNVDAVYYALGAMKGKVIWIAGGLDKGNDYGPIMELVRNKVKALICLGIDNKKLYETFSTEVYSISETTTMHEAVRRAASLASPGDTVLLSPACASFDLFKDYRDRGDQFKKYVKELEDV